MSIWIRSFYLDFEKLHLHWATSFSVALRRHTCFHPPFCAQIFLYFIFLIWICFSKPKTPPWKQRAKIKLPCCLSIYIPWPFPPVWGVADNTKETTKTMGVLLRSSSNDEGLSRVWMALLEQYNPSSPVFHNFHRYIDAYSPTIGLPL